MKHQISFLGGQLLPVYMGIKEFNPDKINFIASDESKFGARAIKELFTDKTFSDFICDPFDFFTIKKKIENIIEKIDEEDEVIINLTGGTKIMLLAAQSVISEKQIKGFYINQDYSLIEVPSYERKKIVTGLSVHEFLVLSGHNTFSAKSINDFATNDFIVSRQIESFAESNNLYFKVTDFIRKKFKTLPESGLENIDGKTSIKWGANFIEIKNYDKIAFSCRSNLACELFFNSVWWELLVAEEVSKWSKAKETLLHCELHFKNDKKALKNEIDILINTGNKLIFVECKSGNIKQEDINKMKIVKQTYGGIISKSLLVSRFMPSQSVLEKCKELDIEVYYEYTFKQKTNPLNRISKTLDKLEKRTSI
jgi:hypothetical protein